MSNIVDVAMIHEPILGVPGVFYFEDIDETDETGKAIFYVVSEGRFSLEMEGILTPQFLIIHYHKHITRERYIVLFFPVKLLNGPPLIASGL